MGVQQEKAVIDLVINGKQSEVSMKALTAATINQRKALYSLSETDPGYKKQKADLLALMAAQQARIVKIDQEKTAWQKFVAGAGSISAGVLGGNMLTMAINKTLAIIPDAIGKYRAFNAASADMSANLNLTAKDVEYFNSQAEKVGPAMGKSGAEMLEGFKLVGSANSELVKTPELLADVTDKAVTLSQASKMTLADATASLVGSMNQFDAGADQAGRFINVMAGGAQVGSAEIGDMAASLKASGIVAHQTGLSFEQTNGALQSLSKESLKGEQAGTMLRNILLTLGAGADETNPRVVGFEKALNNLAKQNLSTAEVTKLFGKENVTAALSLINHKDRVAEFTRGLTGTSAAYDMASKNNATLDHQLEIFWARIEGIYVSVATRLVPAFTSLLKGGNDLITMLPQLGSWIMKNSEWLIMTAVPGLILYNGTLIKATASAIANTVAEGYRRAAYELGYRWMLIQTAATSAYSLITGVLTGQITVQTAVVTIARNVWAAFSAILLANPIGIVVGAFAGLIAAMKYFSEHTKAALDLERQKSALQKQGVKATQDSAKALKDLNEKVGHYNELSKAEQEEIKRTIALKALEAKARLAAAYARAREVARAEGNKPNFWQGVKQGATDFVTGNWGNLAGDGLEKRKQQQAEANKAAAYAEAKDLAGVDQLKADLEQYDQLLAQTNQKREKAFGGGGSGKETDKQKQAAKSLEDMLADSRKRIMEGEKTDYEREVAAFADKYSEMYTLANQSKDKLAKIEEIERLSKIEFEQIDKRRQEKEREKTFAANSAHLEQLKNDAELKIEQEVLAGTKTRSDGDAEKLINEEKYLDASELLNRAYFKTLEELNAGSAEKLAKIDAEKQAALLKIAKDKLNNASQQKENKRAPADKALDSDLAALQQKYDEEQLRIKQKGKKNLLTDAEQKNLELAAERRFLLQKQRLIEQHYEILTKLGVLSADEQKKLELQKNQESIQISNQLLDSEQKQYQGRLGQALKFLDEKQQYMNDAVTIMSSLFKVDQDKLDVGPLLDELDQLQHKTNLTSSEQERMKSIISQVGKVMPDAVSGTDAYGNAIAINTDKAREDVEGQKKRAGIMQKIMIAEKAWALASVGISYGQALMAAIKSAIGLPFPANLAAVASAMAIPTLNLGVSVAKIMGTKIDAPAFEYGGFTNSDQQPSGFTTGATYFNRKNFIAGEKGTEWIMSAPMLKNPVMANLAGALQSLQASGQYRNLGMSSAGGSGSGGGSGSSFSDQLIMQLIAETRASKQEIKAIANRKIEVKYNYFKIREQQDYINEITEDTSLRRSA